MRTFSCILGDDGERGSFVGYSIDKARTISRNSPTVGVVHVELERALCISQGQKQNWETISVQRTTGNTLTFTSEQAGLSPPWGCPTPDGGYGSWRRRFPSQFGKWERGICITWRWELLTRAKAICHAIQNVRPPDLGKSSWRMDPHGPLCPLPLSFLLMLFDS